MYGIFNPLKYVTDYAYEFAVSHDRNKYREYFVTAEEFIKENNLVLGGNISIDLMFSKSLYTNKYLSQINTTNPFVIYSKAPFTYANQLADKFLKLSPTDFPSTYVVINTLIPYKEIDIKVNDRALFKFINIPKYKGVLLFDLIETKEVNGLFYEYSKSKIKVLSYGHLMDIYHRLYSPSDAKNWIKLLEYESLLFNQLRIEFTEKYTKIINKNKEKGDSNDDEIKKSLLKSAITGGGINNKQLYNDIINLFTVVNDKKPSVIIVNIGNDNFNDSFGRLQIVTNESNISIIKQNVDKLIKKHNSNIEINLSSVSVNILEDDFLKKYSLTLTINEKYKITILEIFNSLDYELIPYSIVEINNKKISLANIFVQLRFKFIDIWNLNIILNIMKGEKSEKLIKRIKLIIDEVNVLRETIKDIEFILKNPDVENKDLLNFNKIFQIASYAGVYINARDYRKKMLDKTGFKPSFYYPGRKLLSMNNNIENNNIENSNDKNSNDKNNEDIDSDSEDIDSDSEYNEDETEDSEDENGNDHVGGKESNIKLRKIQMKDKDDLLKITNDEENMKYVGNGKPWNEEKVNKFIKYQMNLNDNKYKYWGIILNEKLIGVVGIHIINYSIIMNNILIGPSDDQYFITIFIDKLYQSKGYGYKSLLNAIKLYKRNDRKKNIYADIFNENIASIKLFKKLKFKEEQKIKINGRDYYRFIL